ncbi:MAG: DinB family protein [Acidimicrobiales bacterium]
MDASEVLIEMYDRVVPLAKQAVAGLDAEALRLAPDGANSIGWLVWHLTRVQDDHLSALFESEQVWVEAGWAERFGLDADPNNIGWGHSPDDVARVRPESVDALLEYLDAVDSRSRTWLRGLTSADLDRIIDKRYDPPVTMGVRLVSVADDCLQHVGQANYLRGINLR